MKPLAILLTHAHFDHIGAVDQVRDTYLIPVYIHTAEKKWLMDPAKNGSGKYARNTVYRCERGRYSNTIESKLDIGSFSLSNIAHTGTFTWELNVLF